MSFDPQTRACQSNPFQSKVNPLATVSGVLRLATMVMSGGALVLPVTWMIVHVDVQGMLMWMLPVFVAWLLAALPVTLTFLRAAGNPWFDGGQVWMAACALLQLAALVLWAFANRAAVNRSDALLMLMFTGLGILAISIPFGVVGWIRYAMRAARPVRPSAAQE